MLTRDLVFAEKVLNYVLATFGIIECTISFEKGADALWSKMSVGNLLFR